jgi:hypothetical protein
MIYELKQAIVEAVFPEDLETLALIKFFAQKSDPYKDLANIMSIYGMINVQKNTNPFVIEAMLKNLMSKIVN